MRSGRPNRRSGGLCNRSSPGLFRFSGRRNHGGAGRRGLHDHRTNRRPGCNGGRGNRRRSDNLRSLTRLRNNTARRGRSGCCRRVVSSWSRRTRSCRGACSSGGRFAAGRGHGGGHGGRYRRTLRRRTDPGSFPLFLLLLNGAQHISGLGNIRQVDLRLGLIVSMAGGAARVRLGSLGQYRAQTHGFVLLH